MENMNFDLKWALRLLHRFGVIIVALGISGAIIGFVLAHWVIHPTYQATALLFTWNEVEQLQDKKTSNDTRKQSKETPQDTSGAQSVSESSAEKSSKIPTGREQDLAQEIIMAKMRSFQLLSMQLTVGNLLMPDFQTLLNSQSVHTKINDQLKEEFGPQFNTPYKITARPVNKTRFVEIAVQCPSMGQTPKIIEIAVGVFSKDATDILGINNVQTIDMDTKARQVAPQNRTYILVGLLAGLLLGSGIAFLIDFCDKSIRDLKDLEERLEMPVLGVLPEVTSMGEDYDGELWQQDTKSVFGEAIRALRVNIEYLLPEKGGAKVFLVTSINKAEGKSAVITSLALAIAKVEKKVLLIDMDLRRPRVHRIFRLPNKAGLVDLLVSKRSLEQLVHRDINTPGFDVLTSGTIPATPSDLLGSRRLEEFLASCAAQYDYIFLDAPPALGMADPMILGKLADSTLLICDCKQANVDKLRGVTERLRQAGVRLGGLVLNRFALHDKSDYYYYYQHYYYGYHYNYSEKSDPDEALTDGSEKNEQPEPPIPAGQQK